MVSFNWKIKEVSFINKDIDFVKYHVTATDGSNVVETEGHATFKLPEEVVFETLKEHELLEYVKRFYIQDNVNAIELNLQNQIENMAKVKSNLPPWHIETFKLEV